jgi:hypothetical protein
VLRGTHKHTSTSTQHTQTHTRTHTDTHLRAARGIAQVGSVLFVVHIPLRPIGRTGEQWGRASITWTKHTYPLGYDLTLSRCPLSPWNIIQLKHHSTETSFNWNIIQPKISFNWNRHSTETSFKWNYYWTDTSFKWNLIQI